MDTRILTAPFIVVKNGETGQYALVFSLEGQSHELLVRNSKEEFEEAIIEVFGEIRKKGNNGPESNDKGPKI